MQVTSTASPDSFAYRNGKLAIVRMSMNGSYAIPLKLLSPQDAKLLTWVLLDFSSANSIVPSCLLVIEFSSAEPSHTLSSLAIQTNIYDRRLHLNRQISPLSRREISILSQALIATIEPENAQSLGQLLPAISPGLDDICAAASNCGLICLDDDRTVIATDLGFVPTCLIASTSAGYICAPVETVRIRFGVKIVMTLLLAAPLDNRHFNGAVLSGNGQHAAARIIKAA